MRKGLILENRKSRYQRAEKRRGGGGGGNRVPRGRPIKTETLKNKNGARFLSATGGEKGGSRFLVGGNFLTRGSVGGRGAPPEKNKSKKVISH